MTHGEDSARTYYPKGTAGSGKVHIVVKSGGHERAELSTVVGSMDFACGPSYNIAIEGRGYSIKISAIGDATCVLDGDVAGITTTRTDWDCSWSPRSISYTSGVAVAYTFLPEWKTKTIGECISGNNFTIVYGGPVHED